MTRVETLPPLPDRPADGHKGTFGRVLIVAGSRGMSGAACLAGTAALRSGSGLVYVAVPDGILSIVAGYEPSYLTIPLADDGDGRIAGSALADILRRSQGMDAVAIGPGLGKSTRLRTLVVEVYRSIPVPLIVDADALNLLAKSDGAVSGHAGPRVLTPHVAEFSRLCGASVASIPSDREGIAARFAADNDVTLVLKGAGTVVTDGSRIAVNTTGNSGMATGGTGDVLTGVIVSLIGQGMKPFDAAQLGVHVHGLAGDMAAAALTQRGLIASDLPAYLPEVWRSLS